MDKNFTRYKGVIPEEEITVLEKINKFIKDIDGESWKHLQPALPPDHYRKMWNTFHISNGHVTELKIWGNERGLPSLVDLEFLETLNLAGPELWHLDLPPSIRSLSTSASQLPNSIWFECVPNLSHLRLSSDSNRFTEKYIQEISELTKFTKLELSNAYVQKHLDWLFDLTYMEQLGFHHCNISEIPEKVGDIKNLKSFYIHCSIDCEIPETFGELKKLEELGFFDTNIHYNPETFAQLESLKHLDLRGYSLDHYRIPHTIGELPNLKILNISAKQAMHYTFAEPPNLVIPDFVVNINSLEELYCHHNSYHFIPDNINEMKNLKILDLSGNKIEILPKSLQECKNLEELNLRGNPLKKIPKWLNMMNLKRFDLGKSDRKKMSENELSKLIKGTISKRIFKNGFQRRIEQ